MATLVSDRVTVGQRVCRKRSAELSNQATNIDDVRTLYGRIERVYPRFAVALWDCGYREAIPLTPYGRIGDGHFVLVGKRAKRR